MTDHDDLSEPLQLLLRRAAAEPSGVLSLTGEETALHWAERLTDLGLFRVVTARRYALTEAGKAALLGTGGDKAGAGLGSWLRTLWGHRAGN